jgi:hypothetical protein
MLLKASPVSLAGLLFSIARVPWADCQGLPGGSLSKTENPRRVVDQDFS